MQNNAASAVVYEAYRVYKKGRFLEVLALLDSPALASSRDPLGIILCAMACLQLNKFSRAEELLSKAGSIAPHYSLYHQLRGFLYLKAASDFESALLYYGELLGKYPSDKAIAKSLARLRRVRQFDDFQRNAKLEDFVMLTKPSRQLFRRGDISKPEGSRSYSSRKYAFVPSRRAFLIILAAILLGSIGIIICNRIIPEFVSKTHVFSSRYAEIEQISLDGSGFELLERISKKTPLEYYYNAASLQEDFRASKQLIKNGRLNAALITINKIIHSNANMSVRERAAFLKSFISAIEDREWEEVPFTEIMKRPHLYGGFSLAWKGKIANYKKRQNASVFHLLIDYRSTDQFAGIAEVFCEQCGGELKNGDMVSVKGIFMDVITAGTPYLHGREALKVK